VQSAEFMGTLHPAGSSVRHALLVAQNEISGPPR
jgi:hypothetical protein